MDGTGANGRARVAVHRGPHKILKSTDEAAKESISAAANSGDEGVLARDTATGQFEIVADTDLQAIIGRDLKPAEHEKVADVIYEPAFDNETSIEELSLVSTLALKKILKKEDLDEPVAQEMDHSGFDPYDSG
jgi:hypothetical protein